MFDSPLATPLAELLARVGQVVSAAEARAAAASGADRSAGAEEVEVIAACEQITHMVTAVQLDAVATLDARRRATHPPADPTDPAAVTRAERAVERSVRAEVSMARGVSSDAAQRSHDLARALRHHPQTRSLLASGVVSPRVARAVCRETEALAPMLRRRVDADLARVLPELTLRQAGGEARRLALALDADSAATRAERARLKRSVRLRRNADAMATLSVYGPAEEVIAAWNQLARRSLTDQAAGRSAGRTQRQLLCDLALDALRAPASAAASDVPRDSHPPAAEIGVLMRPEVLFGSEDTPAVLEGYGPIPAALGRKICTDAGARGRSWVRRLFTTPTGDRVTTVDSRRRRFPADVARLIRASDDTCLRPSCDDAVRELDHVHPHALGGPSTAANGAGVCQPDNLLKEMRGWDVAAFGQADASIGDPLAGAMSWRTPTGHVYSTRRGRPGGGRAPEIIVPRSTDSVVEAQLAHLITRLQQ